MTHPATVRVRDVSDLVTKGTTPTTIGRKFTPSGVRFLKVETFTSDGSYLPGREAYIDRATHQLLKRSQLAQGDILFSIAGALGRSTVVDEAWLPANTNQAFAIIRPSKRHRVIHPRYLLWQLRSPGIAQHIAEINVQAAQANLSLEQVRDFEIPLVPLDEQMAIADVLDDADIFISCNERLLSKKQSVKQAMMQRIFPGGLLSGDNWQEHHLGEMLMRPPRYGINAAAVPLRPGIATYIRITDISDSGRFAPDPKVGVSHPSAADYRLGPGELVLARTGASVGKSYLYEPRDGELVYAGFLINVAPNPRRLSPKFLSLHLQTTRYWDWVRRTSVRSGQPGINGQEYARLPIALPSIETQNAIANSFADIEQEIDVLERRLAKARAVKTGLMQQLLTGRARLPVKEVAV